ncbi:MAG: peptidase U32 family protein, partial [Clostridiaceae bacterium]
MSDIELLAPSGDMESLVMAVQNGADAVYLGGTKFSARAYASNFTEEELENAVDYCHSYGVRVHITLNTLLKDSELNEALDYAKFLYKIGIDALIVQDTGLIYHLSKILPDFELHASTQLSVHNGDGAIYYTNKGIKRIVLARELSFPEIKHISKELGIETEIFVHGALCISYSGQCLMSSILG